MRCVLTHALFRYIEQRGARYGWQYDEGMKLIGKILPAIATLVTGSSLAGAERELEEFCQQYSSLCSCRTEPYDYCAVSCGKPLLCLYRYSVEPLLRDSELSADLADAGADVSGLAQVCERAAERILAWDQLTEPTTAWRRYAFEGAALCYLIQKSAGDPSGWPVRNRREALGAILSLYTRPA
jgi:hypothetical protein